MIQECMRYVTSLLLLFNLLIYSLLKGNWSLWDVWFQEVYTAYLYKFRVYFTMIKHVDGAKYIS